LGRSQDTVIAGLLHDTVEDTHLTLHEIEEMFGEHVKSIVEVSRP
jgi:GTP pyrophosphokinase